MKADKKSLLEFLESIKADIEGLERIGLFGSFARGEESVYSDIDIAVSKKREFFLEHGAYSYFEMIAKLKKMVSERFHRPVDIFDLDSESTFKRKIESELIDV
ncbi:hypothetical protein NNO_0693 [Hydrogenimonas sp.]|nr:hypothetical protein NNO_0693 [Hydrogenimonas sp.]